MQIQTVCKNFKQIRKERDRQKKERRTVINDLRIIIFLKKRTGLRFLILTFLYKKTFITQNDDDQNKKESDRMSDRCNTTMIIFKKICIYTIKI